MKNKIFGFVISVMIGSIANPGVLASADNFDVLQPEFKAVETVEIVKTESEPGPKTEPAVVTQAKTQTSTGNTSGNTTQTLAVAPVSAGPANNIKFGNKTLEIVDVNSTTLDAGSKVFRYNGKFLYGHNSAAVFGDLSGQTEFTVTTGGVTRRYRVVTQVVFEKNATTGRLELNGSGNYMNLVAKAKHNGVQYDLAIMTCAGTTYGNGDASHRLVVFANAI